MTHSDTPQKSVAELQAEALEALTVPGGRRKKLLKMTKDADTELRPLVVAAVDARVSLRAIQAKTGLTPNSIREWTTRAKKSG